METSLLVAIISALGSILSAIAGPYVRWILEALGKRDPKWSVRALVFVGLVVAGSGAVAVVGTLMFFYRFSPVTPSFTPARTEVIQSNASNVYQVVSASGSSPREIFDLSATLREFGRQPSHYLYWRSTLHNDESWTGFFFWRDWPAPAFQIAQRSDLILVIHAATDDILQLGLKDAHGGERKLSFKVSEGWHGYRVPLTKFKTIDLRTVRLFLVAHTTGVGSVHANTFKIALIDVL